MNKVQFTKMAGAGNDFLMLNGTPKGISLKKLAQKSCDRTNGVGADGIIVLDKSKKADYRMRIINADGSEAEMCGNGARCLAAYIVKTKKPKKKLFAMETLAGIVLGQAKGEEAIVRLSDPTGYKSNISINVGGRKINVSYIDTGVPHAVVFVDGLDSINVSKIGHEIRFHKAFKPRGANVNFVEQENKTLVAARTYERGVEDETKACGTGSVASAIIAYLKSNPSVAQKTGARMKVRTKGGEVLEVTFDLNNNTVSNVWLRGSARFIAEGQYYI